MSHDYGDVFEYLTQAETVLEIAIGNRTDLAAALVDAGVNVIAMDVTPRSMPDGVTFVADDLEQPEETVYAEASICYAQRLPDELQRPARDLAQAIDAPLYFTTLGFEFPVIPVESVQTTPRVWYRAR